MSPDYSCQKLNVFLISVNMSLCIAAISATVAMKVKVIFDWCFVMSHTCNWSSSWLRQNKTDTDRFSSVQCELHTVGLPHEGMHDGFTFTYIVVKTFNRAAMVFLLHPCSGGVLAKWFKALVWDPGDHWLKVLPDTFCAQGRVTKAPCELHCCNTHNYTCRIVYWNVWIREWIKNIDLSQTYHCLYASYVSEGL